MNLKVAIRCAPLSSGPALLLFQSQGDIDELDTLLSETASHFTTPGPGGARKQLSSWRVHLNAAKFERLLDERYGRFRPLVERHPEIEVAFKGLQRRYAMGKFSPFRERPVGMSTAIMVLFMMHRQQVRTDALLLAAAFCLVGLQPWALVTLVALGRWEAGRRRDRRARGMPRRLAVCRPYYARGGAEGGKEGAEEEEEEAPAAARRRKHALLAAPVGVPDDPAAASGDDDRPDVLVLGDGAPALYAGALLARAGRRVRGLCPLPDASGCVTHLGKGKSFAGVPFDIGANVVAHLSRQQPLLAPALCTASDAQGGVRFARVGSAADGYAHAVLSVPDAGVEGTVVNAEGPTALAEHCAACLGDGTPGGSGLVIGKNSGEGEDDVGGSASLGYLRAVAQLHETAGSHYLAKLLPGYGGKGDAADGNAYRKACLRSTAGFLDMCLPHTPRVRALMAALGSPHEDAGPAATCLAAHVSHLCAMTSPEGMAYPVGGPRALCHALASVIEQCGGRVVTGVSPQELLFETVPEEGEKEEKDKAKKKEKKEKKEKKGKPGDDEAAESAGPKPRCRGVRLQDGREVAVAEGGAVVSMLGLVPTFLHLVPPPVRAAHGVPPGLPAVSERRPLLRILVGLRGSAVDLDVTGADWHRLSAAAATGGDDAADDGGAAAAGPRPPVRSQRSRAAGETAAAVPTPRRAKFDAGRSWMKVSFPSAKDPSWQARHPGITTCVVTIEADDDFVTAFETRPRIFSTPKVPEGAASRLVDRVTKDLVKNFPQLEGAKQREGRLERQSDIGCKHLFPSCRNLVE